MILKRLRDVGNRRVSNGDAAELRAVPVISAQLRAVRGKINYSVLDAAVDVTLLRKLVYCGSSSCVVGPPVDAIRHNTTASATIKSQNRTVRTAENSRLTSPLWIPRMFNT